MLVGVKRCKGRAEASKEGRRPEQFPCEAFQITEGAVGGCKDGLGQHDQPCDVVGMQADRNKAVDIQLPTQTTAGAREPLCQLIGTSRRRR